MMDLDPRILSLFSSQAYSSAGQLTRDSGLSDLIPGAVLDAKIFEPCGYSLNALVQVHGGGGGGGGGGTHKGYRGWGGGGALFWVIW